jgi:hypothetical protein
MVVKIGMKSGLVGESWVPKETLDVGKDLLIDEFLGELVLLRFLE